MATKKPGYEDGEPELQAKLKKAEEARDKLKAMLAEVNAALKERVWERVAAALYSFKAREVTEEDVKWAKKASCGEED